MQFFQGSHLRDLRCPHSTLGASESKLQMPPPTPRYMPLAKIYHYLEIKGKKYNLNFLPQTCEELMQQYNYVSPSFTIIFSSLSPFFTFLFPYMTMFMTCARLLCEQ